MNLLGIEIGGTKLQLVVGDRDLKVSEHRNLAVDAGRGSAGIRAQIEQVLAELRGRWTFSAVGVGFGGPVDWRTGRICRSHQVEGWSEFDLGGWLHELTSAPVVVENDANTAALGEARAGAGMGIDPAFYVTLGSGVGGGLVVEGKVYHGATPGEAEIGHVRLDREGTIVEARCSGWAVDARIRKIIGSDPGSTLARLAAGAQRGEARFLAPALEAGDPAAARLLEEITSDLAFGLSHVVHLFHPRVIIIGGGLSRLGEPLRAGAAQALRRFIMEAFHPGPQIVLSALGELAVPTGALHLAAAFTRL